MKRFTSELLPAGSVAGKRIWDLWQEYEQGETAEAKFVKDLVCLYSCIATLLSSICYQERHHMWRWLLFYANNSIRYTGPIWVGFARSWIWATCVLFSSVSSFSNLLLPFDYMSLYWRSGFSFMFSGDKLPGLQPFFDSTIPLIKHAEVKHWAEDLFVTAAWFDARVLI